MISVAHIAVAIICAKYQNFIIGACDTFGFPYATELLASCTKMQTEVIESTAVQSLTQGFEHYPMRLLRTKKDVL